MEKISKAQVKLVRSLQVKKFRDETGLFVAEGEKCVSELLKSFEAVSIYREGENASHIEIEQMSGLRTPQGVVAVFKKRDVSDQSDQSDKSDQSDHLLLALDGVQDPGNLGTIIRTCDWFGVHDIVCSKDTADCYNPKVVQATMGALARVRIHYVDLPAWLKEQSTIHPSQIAIYGTLLNGRNMYEVLADNSQSTIHHSQIIVMGNEGNGISPEVRQLITHPILIPPYPNNKASEVIESLNVSIATAIVLAAFRKLVD